MMKLRKLDLPEIQKQLLKCKDCKAEAVFNFLSTCDGMSYGDAMANLEMDAKLYKWNAHTQKAIREGIDVASRVAKVTE